MYYKIRDRGQIGWQAVLRAYSGPETMSGTLHAKPMWLYGEVCWAFMGALPLCETASVWVTSGWNTRGNTTLDYYGHSFIKVALREL